jgi:hypothetical protein
MEVLQRQALEGAWTNNPQCNGEAHANDPARTSKPFLGYRDIPSELTMILEF